MSKPALVEAVYKQHSLLHKAGRPMSKAAVERLVDSVFENASKQLLASSYFRYPGFGVFSIRERGARTAFKNLPKTKGQTVDRSENNKISIPAHSTVKFKPSLQLKNAAKDKKPLPKRPRGEGKESEVA